jgi:2-polyprenyl-3-methyl-5-hydroxy-6-metoxy-1,4-benzoquinol methylase
MSSLDKVINYYREEADFPEQVSEPFQQKIIYDFLLFLSKNRDVNKWQVLDFGSGLGCNLDSLKKFAKKIIACDVNKKALNKSKQKHGFKNISYILFNGTKLSFKDKTFDLVIATEVFEHIPNYKEIMKEIERVVKNKGFFIISTPNYFNLTGIIKKFNDRKNNYTWGPWGGHIGGIERFTTWLNIQKLLAGFRILSSRGADYQKSWFYNNPLFPVRFRKYILIWPGKLPLIKKLGMNYFILAQKK